MSFNSLSFLVFLPVVCILHYFFPHKYRWLFLLIASYFFYCYTNIFLLFLIASSTIVSYYVALFFSKHDDKKVNKRILIIYLILMLGILFVFKYLNFAIDLSLTVLNMFQANLSPFTLNIILPVGISFYTFQTIAYVIDVYNKKANAETHLGYFALFISFFPQLVAGPIESSKNLLPQLRKERIVNRDDFFYGIKFLFSGFVKKIVMADILAIYVNMVFNNISSYSGLSIIIATILFAFEIYGDFSGYSDIAIGAASFLGIRLSKNFDRPYLSSSLSEFWNRWHISLNRFFIEYVYIPLGGSRKGKFRHLTNIFIIFLLSGLWHGASLHFIVWGIIHGLLMIIENLLSPSMDKINSKINKPIFTHILSISATFILVCFSWIFFRANSIGDALLAIRLIFTSLLNGDGLNYFNVKNSLCVILPIILVICVYYLPIIKLPKGENDYSKFSNQVLIYVLLFVIISLTWVYLLSTHQESSFIYFQF